MNPSSDSSASASSHMTDTAAAAAVSTEQMCQHTVNDVC